MSVLEDHTVKPIAKSLGKDGSSSSRRIVTGEPRLKPISSVYFDIGADR